MARFGTPRGGVNSYQGGFWGGPAGQQNFAAAMAKFHPHTLAQQLANSAHGLGGPSPGSYDPALDAQLLNAQTGLAQHLAANQTHLERGDSGYLLSTQEAQHSHDVAMRNAELAHRYAGEDLHTGLGLAGQAHDRALQSLDTQLQQAGQNRQIATENLQRGFTRMGATQTQHAQATGNGDGGALAAALIQRGQNQGIAQQPIDLRLAREQQANQFARTGVNDAYTNRVNDLNTRYSRESTGFGNQSGDLNYGLGQRLGSLGLQHQYQGSDLGTDNANQLQNFNQFKLGIGAEEAYSALPTQTPGVFG